MEVFMKRLKAFAVIASVFLVFGFGMTGCDNGTTGGGGGSGAGMTVTITGIPAADADREWSISFTRGSGQTLNHHAGSDRVRVPAAGGNVTFTMRHAAGAFNTAGTYNVGIANWVGNTGSGMATARDQALSAGANTIAWSAFQ